MTSSREPDPRAGAKERGGPRPIRVSYGPSVFVKKGLRAFDPHDPYHFAISLGWRKFLALFLAAELAINTFFAMLYSLQPGAIANQGSSGFLGALFFSLETLATVGYGEMYPATIYAHVVSAAEILVGLLFTAIMTGLLFVRFSKPRAKIQFATRAVVTPHNGVPTLMFRIGNARTTVLHDVEVALNTLTRSVSAEGFHHVSVVEMTLLRPRIPVFAILYTIMHPIDAASPLHGIASDSPDIAEMRFFLTVRARDSVIGQQVTDIHTFAGADLAFGMRYVDAVERVGDTDVVADYALLSAVEPDRDASAGPRAGAMEGEQYG